MNMEYLQDYLANCKSPVQLVKHMDEVPERQINYPLIAQKKYDGLYVLVVVTHDDIKFFSRTGKEYYWELGEALSQQDFCNLPDGIYIGELCNDTVSLEILAGLVSTNRKKHWSDEELYSIEESYIMFHDFLTLEEFVDGYSEVTYAERLDTLYANLPSKLRKYTCDITMVYDLEEAEAFADTIIEAGGEGAVFKHCVDWQAGHKGYRAMKIVRGLTLDLLCTGVQYGKGKREGQIAKLELSYKGNRFFADLGKGWTDERRKELTQDYEYYEQAIKDNGFAPTYKKHLTPIGRIWEVKALQESSTGKALRLSKVQRVREDKEIPDA